MRKDAKQGVPKRKPRDMAKPMAESGKTKDAPAVAPRTVAPEPLLNDPMLDEPMDNQALTEMPTLPTEPAHEPDAEPPAIAPPEREPEAELAAVSEPEPMPQQDPPAVEVAPPAVDRNAPPLTMRDMFARVEPAFHQFRDAAYRYPAEHMNDRIGEGGWTRKQMLSHIAAWHDLTTDRLLKMALTGQPVALDRDQEAVNAVAARVAVGKTAGEVLKDVEASYARLRRQMLRMTDADLRLGDGWAAGRIASNTYEHYGEHIADLAPPVALPGSGAQR
jgi:hypothetical protein